jgi:hypothetical protein
VCVLSHVHYIWPLFGPTDPLVSVVQVLCKIVVPAFVLKCPISGVQFVRIKMDDSTNSPVSG